MLKRDITELDNSFNLWYTYSIKAIKYKIGENMIKYNDKVEILNTVLIDFYCKDGEKLTGFTASIDQNDRKILVRFGHSMIGCTSKWINETELRKID